MTALADRSANRWLRRVPGDRATGLGAVVFFPYAGGSATAAVALSPAIPDGWDFWGVQYPGRGPRFREAPGTALRDYADGAAAAIAGLPGPTVLFGHSFGAYVALETARRLHDGGRAPTRVVVSAARAPGSDSLVGAEHLLDDADFTAVLARRDGMPPEVLANPELLALALPAIRSDFDLAHRYEHSSVVPVAVPLAAIGGDGDEVAPADTPHAWQRLTDRWRGAATAPGGPLYYLDDPPAVASALRSTDQGGRRNMAGGLRVRTGGVEPPTVDLAGADPLDWFGAHREAVDLALTEHGALYFARAGVRDRADFAAIRDLLFQRRAEYREKATPRTDFGAGVYSSTDLPPSQPIRQHNENSYTLTFPGKLLFGCLTAADSGGATTVADVRRVLAGLPDAIVRRMADVGWRLLRTYHDTVGLSWQVAFNTTDPAQVEAYCADNAIDWCWVNDELRTEQVRPGILEHPVTGERVWFNHAAFWSQWSLEPDIRQILVDEFGADRLPFNTAYGDGTALPRDEADAINRAYDDATRRREWRPGDLLLVDNLLSSHGRDAFTGSRNVVVAMGEPVALADCRAIIGPGVKAR